MYKNKDTIFAVSTPPGKSAMSIVRISGAGAFNIVSKISSNMPSVANKATLNKLRTNKEDVIDETITTIFKSPKSYTGEDVVEISLHGSSAVINNVLKILGENLNCRLAEPGEFTRRAFENNKLDLTQVEAIGDLINSETEAQRKQALKQLEGKLSNKIKNISSKIVKNLANVEAVIDFSDDDIPNNIIQNSKEQIKNIINEIIYMLKDNNIGEKIRSGFTISIIGNPNVGKSSFINKVSKREVAIVTKDPGTTRDIIEVFIDFKGIPLILYDTAGIRTTINEAEKLGVLKAYKLSERSDINLVLIEDKQDICKYKEINNKIFIQSKIDILPKIHANKEIFYISSKTGEGFNDLFNNIYSTIMRGSSTEDACVSRERHRQALSKTLKNLENSLEDKNIDIFAEDIRLAMKEITKITGNIDIEDILEIIFNDFCIGK